VGKVELCEVMQLGNLRGDKSYQIVTHVEELDGLHLEHVWWYLLNIFAFYHHFLIPWVIVEVLTTYTNVIPSKHHFRIS
jgi:hypothetical protein